MISFSQDSERYRFPRTTADGFAEIFNLETNLPASLGVRQTVEIEISPSYGSQIECPKQTHEGVDKQLGTLRARGAVIITKASCDRRRDTSVNDTGSLRGCHVRRVHGIKVQANLWHALQQSAGTKKCPF